MVTYPDNLPLPLLAGYGLNQKSNLIRTELTTGRARQRRRFLSVPTIAPTTWLFNQEQAAFFEGWLEHAIDGGAAWFEINLKTPLGMKICPARFVTSPLEKCTVLTPTLWQYQADIEIDVRPTQTEQQTAEAFSAPEATENLINRVAGALNSYLE